MLKKLFYASASILILALACHFGATTATAHAPGDSIVAIASPSPGVLVAVTANGNVYDASDGYGTSWTFKANIFTSGPTPAQH